MATALSQARRKEAAIARIEAATAGLTGDDAADLRTPKRNKAEQEIATLEAIATRIEAMAAQASKPAKATRAKKTPAAAK